MKTKVVFGFIAGHGGMDEHGRYTTAPHKMHIFPDGKEVHEGVINRHIVELTLNLAKWEGLQCINIVEEVADVPLKERVERVKRLHKTFAEQDKELILFEVHCNASTYHNARGFESFSSMKENFSDTISQIWISEMARCFPKARNRGDKDKDFYVVFNVPCYGVLNEHFFFDNEDDVKDNLNAEALKNHALAYIRTMHRVTALRSKKLIAYKP